MLHGALWSRRSRSTTVPQSSKSLIAFKKGEKAFHMLNSPAFRCTSTRARLFIQLVQNSFLAKQPSFLKRKSTEREKRNGQTETAFLSFIAGESRRINQKHRHRHQRGQMFRVKSRRISAKWTESCQICVRSSYEVV